MDVSMKESFINDFTDGSIPKKLLRFIIPFMLSNGLQVLYSLVDMIIVGRYVGSLGLSAVSVASQVSTFMTVICLGISTGGQIFISQLIGCGERQKLCRVIGTVFSSVFILSLVLSVSGLVFSRQILLLLDTPAEAFAMAESYLLVCSAGMVFSGGYNMVAAVLRGMGDSKRPFVFILIALGIIGGVKRTVFPIMISGVLTLIASCMLLCFSNTPFLMWIARGLAGVGAASWVCFTVYYSESFAKSSRKAMGRAVAANNLGMLSAYVAGSLLYDRVGIVPLFIISGASALLSCIILMSISHMAPTTRNELRFSASNLISVFGNCRLWITSLITALSQVISFATMISFSANYALSIGCTGAQVGLMSITNTFGGFLASYTIASGKLESIREKHVVACGFIMLMVYCVALPHTTGIAGILALQFFGGIGRNLIMALQMSRVVSLVETTQKSIAMGIYQSVYGLGMSFGPMLMGCFLGLSNNNYSLSFLSMSMVAVLGIAISLLQRQDTE